MTAKGLSARWTTVLGVLLTLALGTTVLRGLGGTTALGMGDQEPARAECPDGYKTWGEIEAGEPEIPTGALFEVGSGTPETEAEGEYEAEAEAEGEGKDEGERAFEDQCVSEKHPESVGELAANFAQHLAINTAPFANLKPGARLAALEQLATMRRGNGPLKHEWTPFGNGPLDAADRGFDSVNGLGNVYVNGRITDFSYDTEHEVLYASVAMGGVWKSTDFGQTWSSIGDSLPSQTIGSVGYTPAAGGRLIAITGDGSFGASSIEGVGAYYSDDDGATWTRSKGVPAGAFGFKVAVDQANPKIVYLATGTGLFRSDNAGESFRNVDLPTGTCAGRSNRSPGCLFDNIVTDVTVKAPGGTTEEESDEAGSPVVAAVGWRGGNYQNPDGTVQSENNGIYVSDTGAVGTFAKVEAPGFAPQDRIGRIELGAATGPDQDHNYLYATVQDAYYFALRSYPPSVESPHLSPTELTGAQFPHIFNGVYVSSDFGRSWTLMESGDELNGPQTGSALAVAGQALAYIGPGVQTWYNQFIAPDPTRQAGGIPTRVIFGMEEVWQNELTSVPQAGPSSFRVIGRYFSGATCMLLGWPGACPTQRDNPPDSMLTQTATTHPDQHAVVFVPHDGKLTLVVGNDGGVYTQTVDENGEFSNAQWGEGDSFGMNTLLPYYASRAKDGTVWMGLQDNGTAKIVPEYREKAVEDDPDTAEDESIPEGPLEIEKQLMTKGGDGFFTAVDPDNSDIAYGEYVGGAIAGTKDGGETWSEMSPPITKGQFSTPFVMDPLDPEHLMIAGNEVVETGSGPGTSAMDWATVFDLGTRTAPGNPKAEATAESPDNQMSAIDMRGPYAYVGYCGTCDILNNPAPFQSGLATNVAGNLPAERYSSDGWHIAAAKGLPNRYITSIAMDPKDPKTVYVSLGGYSRRWTPPGAIDQANDVGEGHVFKSTDGGETFRNLSFNLPDAPMTWVELRGKQLLVASDVGVFASRPGAGCLNNEDADEDCDAFATLGRGLPNVAVSSIEVAPGDCNLITIATNGRGVWEYRFGPEKPCGTESDPGDDPGPDPANQGTEVATFDFELGEQGFTAKSTSDTSTWRRGSPGHTSTGSMQLMPYTDEMSGALISPEMELPERSNVELSWWQMLNLEECCDSLTAYWSSDGYKWYKLESYFDSVVLAANEGRVPDWTEQKVSFTAPAGKLFVRFVVTSDALVSAPAYTGAMVDDIKVTR